MEEKPSSRAMTYLRDLITRHPNFRKTFEYSSTLQDENDEVWLIDEFGDKICTSAEAMTSWLNQKYHQYFQDELTSLSDLDKASCSELIGRFEAREKKGK
jgi:hypothetical protein